MYKSIQKYKFFVIETWEGILPVVIAFGLLGFIIAFFGWPLLVWPQIAPYYELVVGWFCFSGILGLIVISTKRWIEEMWEKAEERMDEKRCELLDKLDKV